MCADTFREMNKVAVSFYPYTKANSTLIVTSGKDETGKGEQQGYANEDQHKSKVWIEQGTEFSANG